MGGVLFESRGRSAFCSIVPLIMKNFLKGQVFFFLRQKEKDISIAIHFLNGAELIIKADMI